MNVAVQHPAFVIRPVASSDEAAIGRLLAGLDPESRHRRWFSYAVDVRRAARWAAHPEIDSALGLVAVAGHEIIGHGVMIPLADDRAEVAFEVAEPWRRHGVAGELLTALVAAATRVGIRELRAEVLEGNDDMLAVLREHGLHSELRGGGVISVGVPIRASADLSTSEKRP